MNLSLILIPPFDLQDSLSLIITIVTLNACHTSDSNLSWLDKWKTILNGGVLKD